MCGTFYLELRPYLWLASAGQKWAYSYSVVLCGSAFIHLFLHSICCGHFVCQWPIFCCALRGILKIFLVDILTPVIILQKYLLYFPWMSLRCFHGNYTLKMSPFCGSTVNVIWYLLWKCNFIRSLFTSGFRGLIMRAQCVLHCTLLSLEDRGPFLKSFKLHINCKRYVASRFRSEASA